MNSDQQQGTQAKRLSMGHGNAVKGNDDGHHHRLGFRELRH